jgi:K+-sensing histidine kinase KdpD
MDIYNRTKEKEKKESLISKIFDVAVQLSTTVQDLSEILNINQNKEVERENLFFETALQNQIIYNTSEIMKLNAEIEYDFSDCPTINYPKVYLESILLNLLTNSLKYSSPDRTPQISFRTYKDDKGIITFTCKDNGLGIDLNKYGKKIFSLHKTFHNKPDARGVGLFITKQQVKSLGGDISVQSIPNEGTTFTIKFNQIEVL